MSQIFQVIPLLNGAVYTALDHILYKQARPLGKPLSEIMPSRADGITLEDIVSPSPGLWVPIIVWLLLGSETPILVDTGLSSCEELHTSLLEHSGITIPCRQNLDWKLDRQLKKYGVAPNDIEHIILTHLHGDHLGNNEMFPNAQYFVHESEIPLCLNPPKWAPFYRPDNASHLRAVMDRIKPLSGDYQLKSGIRLLHVGGHSPGLMTVQVQTKLGSVAIASDLVHSYENLNLNWPIGAFWNLNEVMEGMNRLREEVDFILPNHDWAIWMHYPEGKIG
jgi:glyoxylase-like metal-dependent hydrolase (beta-lactamase superfamily II)